MAMTLRAALVSLLLFGTFIGAWHLATRGSGPVASMDPEYAKLVGAAASQGKSAMPGPGEVAGKIWEHLRNPFYDRGSNDKGLGIQLAFSIARVLTGYLMAVAVAIPVGFLIGMSPPRFGSTCAIRSTTEARTTRASASSSAGRSRASRSAICSPCSPRCRSVS